LTPAKSDRLGRLAGGVAFLVGVGALQDRPPRRQMAGGTVWAEAGNAK